MHAYCCIRRSGRQGDGRWRGGGSGERGGGPFNDRDRQSGRREEEQEKRIEGNRGGGSVCVCVCMHVKTSRAAVETARQLLLLLAEQRRDVAQEARREPQGGERPGRVAGGGLGDGGRMKEGASS